MKNEVNNCLSRTPRKNREKKSKRYENFDATTLQPATLLCIQFPPALFNQIPKEKGKYLSFFYFLKAEVPASGWIQNYRSQVSYLSKKFGLSEISFLAYLKEVEKLKIIFSEENKIRLIGWKQLGHVFHCDTKQKSEIKFLPGKDNFPEWISKNLNF